MRRARFINHFLPYLQGVMLGLGIVMLIAVAGDLAKRQNAREAEVRANIEAIASDLSAIRRMLEER